MAEPEVWGDDPKLVELLGEQGEAGFRALFDGFPESVGVLWARRDDAGKVVDFTFGYGNPSILRAFRLPPSMRDRYTLLEALPPMRGSHAFDAYVEVCESGEPWVQEVTYDTPFGDGYMLGTFVQRTVKLGDGLINFLTDVTEQRRMEAELRSYADVVAHDLNEPIAGITFLVGLLERRAAEPPPRRRAPPAPDERRARPRSDRRRAALRAGGRAGDRAGRARAARRRGRRGPAPAPGAGRRDGRERRAAGRHRRPAAAAPRACRT